MRKYPLLAIIVGATNSGKTTLAKKTVANRKRVLAVTPHLNEWTDYETINTAESGFWKFNGIKRAVAHKNIIKEINANDNYFRNGVIIFEEARFYIKAKVEEAVEQMLIARDQRKIDILVVAHGLTLIPPIFFNYADMFIMFRTQDNLQKRKKDLIWYEELKELQNKVNEQAKTDPHYYDIFKTRQ